ncbi:hypothetical protein IEO21_07531 [Rhodonia placenta]|uniref:Uncharacterized protein n=1 Tax=Rhodonia placenta TaxID=104341 RepID=A0A8H7U038_9APHY|nr:hypothetical protein IEO21_07531 [Postia placenta]
MKVFHLVGDGTGFGLIAIISGAWAVNNTNTPSWIFDDFLSIPALATNVKTRSFLSLVQVEPVQKTANLRGYKNTVPLTEITQGILNDVLTEAQYWGEQLQLDSDQIISYDVEPFLPTILTHGGPSAYAHRALPSLEHILQLVGRDL